MPSREEIQYFGAGPAPLPIEVLESASRVLLNYKESGIGITEISHRSADANAILAHAQAALTQLLHIPVSPDEDGYQILFLQGGGSGEFSAVVYHMISIWVAKRYKALEKSLQSTASIEEALSKEVASNLRLDYLVTGSWSLKASQEAGRLIGSDKVNIVVDARKHNHGKFGVIPPTDSWTRTLGDSGPALTYYCDNETVDGVEFPYTPVGENLVADMSSNFLSRPVDVRRFKAIFGGAQKNIGTTGITIAIVSNSILPPFAEMASPDLLRKLQLPIGPVVLDWPTVAKNNSLYNTLPIFDVWIAGTVMQRLLDRASDKTAGINHQEKESREKAALIYETLDRYDIYRIVPQKNVRSRMNICLRIRDGSEAAEKAFLDSAVRKGLLGLKGHRSVGGIRISNYNAVSMQAVEKLVAHLDDFAQNLYKDVQG